MIIKGSHKKYRILGSPDLYLEETMGIVVKPLIHKYEYENKNMCLPKKESEIPKSLTTSIEEDYHKNMGGKKKEKKKEPYPTPTMDIREYDTLCMLGYKIKDILKGKYYVKTYTNNEINTLSIRLSGLSLR